MELLLEKGIQTIDTLSNVDKLFKELKKNTDDHEKTKTKIEQELKTTFGCDFYLELHYMGLHSNNCGVLPIYKSNIKTIEKNENVVKLNNISKMFIILGMQLVQMCTPKELTAVILHEIGHSVNHLINYIRTINEVSYSLKSALEQLFFLPIIIAPLFIITSRTFYWTEHIGEYNADKFVAEYGYGDEFINLLHKFDLKEKKENKKNSKIISFINSLRDHIIGASHPNYDKRILALGNEIKDNYAKYYNSKNLKKILDKYA